MNDTEMRCNFWLPRKNRFCSNTRFKDSQFCGNHTRRSDGQWIQCPIDPSHSVLQGNLDWHVKRCPLLKQVQSLSLQPFYQKGINAGSEGEAEVGHTLRLDDDSISPNVLVLDSLDNISSELKRNAVHSMSIPEFHNLIKKIESIHESLCKDIQDSYQMPEACNIWIKRGVERKIPFQEKHVMQQASILGNLEKFGVLKNSVEKSTSGCEEELHKDNNNDIPVVVEFGAGRGYLTQLLADCYGIKRVFLVERQAYKLKADRSLRQKESLIVERLRIDIEDLDLNVVLRGVHFLAIGKHLCGPATDLTLRCCFSDHIKDNTEQCNTSKNLGGLAIATCCHHLCQWKHYINKKYFSDLGISKEEFHAITWFTSWAVDDNHGSDLPNVSDFRLHLQFIVEEKCDGYASGVEEIVRNMEATQRAGLGFICKQIIDMGRLMWVKERGFHTQLVKYVPSSISPENNLLIAYCTNHLAS